MARTSASWCTRPRAWCRPSSASASPRRSYACGPTPLPTTSSSTMWPKPWSPDSCASPESAALGGNRRYARNAEPDNRSHRSSNGRAGEDALMAGRYTLTRTLIDLADTLVDDFDVIELLTMLVDRCPEILEVTAAGLMLVDADGA